MPVRTPAALPLLAVLVAASPAWAAPVDIIRGVPAGGSWNQEIKKVMVSMFDTNGSGLLDSEAELKEVGCDIWRAIDEGVRRDWRGASVASVYGFAEGQFWSGGELGVAEAVRAPARAIMEGCGIVSTGDAPPAGDPTAPGAAPATDVAPAIAALAAGDSSAWGNEVEKLLLSAYDGDQSGQLQTLAELASIPCTVWRAMEDGVKRDWSGTGLRVIYGFDSDYIWVGDAFSIDESLRTATVIAAATCGVGAPLSEPATAIAGLPEGGQDGWDTFVSRAVIAAWDADGDHRIGTAAEARAVSCETWSAMDQGVRAGWGSGIRQVYGFGPELIWVGSAVGFDEGVRQDADGAAAGCGLELGAAPQGGFSASDVLAGPGRVSTASVVQAIDAAGQTGDWDTGVQSIVTAAYDLDRSGSVNTSKELKLVPCAVWSAIDRGVQGEWSGTGMRVIYGFKKGFIWVGYALGFDEKIRKSADKAAARCGLQ